MNLGVVLWVSGHCLDLRQYLMPLHEPPKARIRLVVQVVFVELPPRAMNLGVVSLVQVKVWPARPTGQACRPLLMGVLSAVLLVAHFVEPLGAEVIVVRFCGVADIAVASRVLCFVARS